MSPAQMQLSRLREWSAAPPLRRGMPGEGLAAGATLTRNASRSDLSRAAGEVCRGTRSHRRSALLLLLSALALAACGKKGPPDPPGPQNEIIYPHVYPSK